MSEESATLSHNHMIEQLLKAATAVTLPLSGAQADAVASLIEPATAQECARAVAYIQAFSTQDSLDDLPRSFWRSSTKARQLTGIVLSYLIEGLSSHQRDVLWLSMLLKDRPSHALFLDWLDMDETTLQVCLSELEQKGLVHKSDTGLVAQPVPPVLDWAQHHMEWTKPRTTTLLHIHAQHLLNEFPPERVWASIFNSVAELDLAQGLRTHRDEIHTLAQRIKPVDLDVWSQLICMVLVCDLFQGNTTDLNVFDAQITQHHPDIRDHVCASRLLMIWTRMSFPHTGQFQTCLVLLEQAKQRLTHIEDKHLRDRLELGLVLERTFFHERMNIDVLQIANEFESVHQQYKTYEHIPEALQITMLRFMSRLQFSLKHDERAADLAEQALKRARQTKKPGLICVGLLEVAESCSRLGKNDAFEARCNEILELCDAECFPGFVNYIRLALGYAHFGAGKTLSASALFEGALPHYTQSGEHHNTQFLAMMLAAMDLEEGHIERALNRLQGLAEGLDVTREHAIFAAPQLVLTICAMLYAMCDELHLAHRVLHDAHAYKARCADTTYMSWGIDYVTAHVHIIQAVLAPTAHGGLAKHTQLLDTLRAQRQLVDQADLLRDGLLYFRQGLDRLMDSWLAVHGVSLKNPIQIHIDTWEPTWFAINHLPRVSIKRRQAMRRLLTALLHHSRSSHPQPLSLEEMFATGWPDEVASYESMQARVYNTVSRMRKLGLDELIQHDGEGYQWNTSCEVVLEQTHLR